MGFFEEAGRAVERFKRSVTDDEAEAYRCEACEEHLDENYDHCPACGEPEVVAVATGE